MKHFKYLSAGLLLAMLMIFSSFALATGLPGPIKSQTLAPMLEKVMPAVVNVSAQITMPIQKSPFGPSKNQRSFDPRRPYKGKIESVGSGVIVNSKKGYILTNAHLVHKADSISVSLGNGRHFKAKLIGIDVPSDLAVLQIDGKTLHAIKIGNSNKLKVGDYVLAIGNPFGLSQTVTSGIVSALERTNLNIEGYENFIQTDAAINTGNSGGALVNMKGELVGINTAILSTSGGGNVGIGFAIPINMARSVMEQLIRFGKVERGLLGVVVQNFTPTLAEAFSVPDNNGAVITQVTPNSPAEHAGLKVYDIIEKVNGELIKDATQVRNVIGVLRIGDKISVQYRRGKRVLTTHLTVGNPEEIARKIQESDPLLLGLDMQNFDQETIAHGRVKGVQVLDVADDSPADRIHMRPGDVIIAADKQPVHSLSDLEKIAKHNKNALLLHIYRGQGSLLLVLK